MTASTSKLLQLSLFPNHVRMTQAIPYADQNPYYLMRAMPTLFGEWVLLREWERIGSPGRVRRDRHRTEGEAVSALTKLAYRKCRQGHALEQMD